MAIFDDRTNEAAESNGRLVLSSFNSCDEAVFKASYIVTTDVICKGKITALFDLIIIGNITAAELDVKGKFVCCGECNVSGSIDLSRNPFMASVAVNFHPNCVKIPCQ